MTTTLCTKTYKVMHDEIHGGAIEKNKVTILTLPADADFSTLHTLFRAEKAKEGQTSIDIFGIWEEQAEGEWKRVDTNHNAGVLREPIFTDDLYYYQMNKEPSPGDLLAGKWVGCGMVNPATKDFYLKHFAANYRTSNPHEDDCKVVIVRGSFGNVAGRDARGITDSDIVERYNF